MHELVQEWLAKAEEDWDSARVLLSDFPNPVMDPEFTEGQTAIMGEHKTPRFKNNSWHRPPVSTALRRDESPGWDSEHT